jgi:hypothetical protein
VFFKRRGEEVLMLDSQSIREKVALIESKREFLVRLLEQPNLGTLRIDVNQAIEEMDDLLDEFDRTFPKSNNEN